MVYEASLLDVDRIVEMGRNFRSNTVYRSIIAESVESMTRLAETLIVGDSSVILLDRHSDLDSPAVAMLGLTVYKHPISGQLTACELFWWVEPEHRGRGVRLLKAAERWAHSRGACALQMIAPTSDVAAIYDRLGFTPVETTYQKRLNG